MADFSRRVSKPSLALAILSTLWLGGCADKSTETEANQTGKVLALVGDEAITEQDLQHMLERSFDDEQRRDAGLQDKVLESLIASRAMQQLAREQMSQADVEAIQSKARAYEEELYVQAYLERNIDPRPVTGEMVRHYYEQNPEQFGGEARRHFELLVAPANLDEQRQAQLLAQVPAIRAHDNWSQLQAQWQQQFGLQYQKGQSRPGLLQASLDSELGRLEEGETSSVIYVDGQLHLIRLSEIRQSPPRPFSQVRDEIRQKLAPLHLRDAVREASQHALTQVAIEIPTEDESNR